MIQSDFVLGALLQLCILYLKAQKNKYIYITNNATNEELNENRMEKMLIKSKGIIWTSVRVNYINCMMIVPSYVPGIHSSAQCVLLPFSVKVMRSEEGAH